MTRPLFLIAATAILLVGLITFQSANPQYGTGTIDMPSGRGSLIVPSNMYVSLESYTPTYTAADWATYPTCQYNQVTGFEQSPCYFLFPEQGKRWVVFRYCASGQKPGTPAQCWCKNGMAGNSGKCK